MLHAIPSHHGILPAREVRILSRIPRILCIFQDARNRIIPHDEGEVSPCALVAHEPVAVGKMGVEHFNDAVDFVVVAFAGGWEGLGVEDVEPGEVLRLGRWVFDGRWDIIFIVGHTMLLGRNKGLGLKLGSRTTARGRRSREMKDRLESVTCHKS